MVLLKWNRHLLLSLLLVHLHSNMVLLKLEKFEIASVNKLKFTFQYGSTQIVYPFLQQLHVAVFTFQYGSTQI